MKNSIKTARIKGVKEGLKEGKQIGLEEGMKIGIEEIARKIAKNLKVMAIDNEIIAKGMELNIEEIEKL